VPLLPLVAIIDHTGNYQGDPITWVRLKYKTWLEFRVMSHADLAKIDSKLARLIKQRCAYNKRTNKSNRGMYPTSVKDIFPGVKEARKNQSTFYAK